MNNSNSRNLFYFPERDFTTNNTDWERAGDSEIEWGEDSSSLFEVGDRNCFQSNETEIYEELQEKNQLLEEYWKEAEESCLKMKKENEKLIQQLDDEKQRSMKFQKKLQYIQDNHAIFERLKQAYLNMKYNESVTRPLVEIQEKECQTYQQDQISLNFLENINNVFDKGTIVIQRKDLDDIKNTVQSLKALIDAQTVPFAPLCETREAKYRKDIAILFKENINLKQQISDYQIEVSQVNKPIDKKKSQKDNSVLRKIIAKLAKRLRSCTVNCDQEISGNYMTNLNEKEQSIIQHITAKYDAKLQRLNLTSPKNDKYQENNLTPFYTPRSSKSEDFNNEEQLDLESCETFRSCEGSPRIMDVENA